MKQLILIIMFLKMLIGCQSKALKIKDAQNIQIINSSGNVVYEIADEKKIQSIISIVESAKKEPVKFIAGYKLNVKTKDTILVFLIKDDLLNDKGIIYRMQDNLVENIDK
ncbi:hypothetical protein [uncultured Chryseobacterium sp.]|jgi:hypothetical protein|uniref:hypothetical protein n=1 Tax=uncultured Chryseobacterium sp. TaxID=259322 RepID=UPI0026394A94|nr:hypothetical protein [uncultured Chryseobacterium sp.]